MLTPIYFDISRLPLDELLFFLIFLYHQIAVLVYNSYSQILSYTVILAL